MKPLDTLKPGDKLRCISRYTGADEHLNEKYLDEDCLKIGDILTIKSVNKSVGNSNKLWFGLENCTYNYCEDIFEPYDETVIEKTPLEKLDSLKQSLSTLERTLNAQILETANLLTNCNTACQENYNISDSAFQTDLADGVNFTRSIHGMKIRELAILYQSVERNSVQMILLKGTSGIKEEYHELILPDKIKLYEELLLLRKKYGTLWS